MSFCSFDNPDSMRREAYIDGALELSLSRSVLTLSKAQKALRLLGLGAKEWSDGQVIGDARGLPRRIREKIEQDRGAQHD